MVMDPSKRILVVDDDRLIRRMLVTALRMKALDVDEAEDGRSALGLLRENRYAVVLLDLFMPEFDGFQVLDTLYADSEVQGPPVVIVVTGADTDSIARLDSSRIHGVIRKPFEVADAASLERYLGVVFHDPRSRPPLPWPASRAYVAWRRREAAFEQAVLERIGRSD